MLRTNLLIFTLTGLLFFASCATVEVTQVQKLEYDNQTIDVSVVLTNHNWLRVRLKDAFCSLQADSLIFNSSLTDTIYIKGNDERIVKLSFELGEHGEDFYQKLFSGSFATFAFSCKLRYGIGFLTKEERFNKKIKLK